MQHVRAPVIAEPGPHLQNIIQFGAREMPYRRPSGDEFLEIRTDRADGRLLQHDFRQPNLIRIGFLPRQCPPRQDAAVLIVPGKKLALRIERIGFFRTLSPAARMFFDFPSAQRHTPTHVHPAHNFPPPSTASHVRRWARIGDCTPPCSNTGPKSLGPSMRVSPRLSKSVFRPGRKKRNAPGGTLGHPPAERFGDGVHFQNRPDPAAHHRLFRL